MALLVSKGTCKGKKVQEIALIPLKELQRIIGLVKKSFQNKSMIFRTIFKIILKSLYEVTQLFFFIEIKKYLDILLKTIVAAHAVYLQIEYHFLKFRILI